MTRQTWQMLMMAGLCAALLPACQLSEFQRKCSGWLRPSTTKADAKKDESSKKGQAPKEKEDADKRVPDVDDPSATYHLIKHPVGPLRQKKTPVPKTPQWVPDLEWPYPVGEQNPPEILPPVQLRIPHDLTILPEPIQQVLPPPDKQEPLVEALVSFLKNQPEDALRQLERYDQDTRDVFQRVLPILTLLSRRKLSEMSSEELASVQMQLQILLHALRSRTSLVIDQMCYCEYVKGFGDYKPLPAEHAFQAGGKRLGELVQVYVELKNVACERRDLYYESRLNSLVEIRDAQDKLIWSRNLGDRNRPEQSLTLRHDYYRNYRFYVPPLVPGKYHLIIQVTDETSRPHRVARKALEFVVAATPDL